MLGPFANKCQRKNLDKTYTIENGSRSFPGGNNRSVVGREGSANIKL